MIRIRPVKTIAEFHTVEQIQKQVWQFADREIIPKNELITIQRNGGVVLGAFLGRKMVGFVFGFPGIKDGKLIHSSRVLAVLPEYRNTDIGYRLKLAQRDFARKQGIKLMTWTFDPLQSLNAYFNIAKLGVTIRQYYVNLYGTSSSILNKGMPTDRFLAEWEIKNDRRPHHKDTKDTKNLINDTYKSKDGLLVCAGIRLGLKDRTLAVEIPADIGAIVKRNSKLALDWRLKTRRIFQHYFGKSYVITGFQFNPATKRGFYILTSTKEIRELGY
ncbi:MAG: hypothetical protein HY762_08420 [Planctomycetes bacterium]|nr:hypothetical protein [Planctomycetota bacterium]